MQLHQAIDKTKMGRKNVTSYHGNKPTYQCNGQSSNGLGGKGAWWNAAVNGRKVVYTDFSGGTDSATAMVWGARVIRKNNQVQCERKFTKVKIKRSLHVLCHIAKPTTPGRARRHQAGCQYNAEFWDSNWLCRSQATVWCRPEITQWMYRYPCKGPQRK